MKLLVLGGGFTGQAAARRVIALGGEVVATTRSEARAAELRALGITPVVLGADVAALSANVDRETRVLVTLPPDGHSDRLLAAQVSSAASIAYVSSTGVYGDAHGRVDEHTPVDSAAPRASARLDAERAWRDAGARIVRAPAIYGPGRGMHLRIAQGELRLAGEGTNAVSRVHVDDLAAVLVLLLALPNDDREEPYVMGDLEPAPHVDVVRFVCNALGVPMPPRLPASDAAETLQHDRRVDSSRLRAKLSYSLLYPTYREGYAHAIEKDRAALQSL